MKRIGLKSFSTPIIKVTYDEFVEESSMKIFDCDMALKDENQRLKEIWKNIYLESTRLISFPNASQTESTNIEEIALFFLRVEAHKQLEEHCKDLKQRAERVFVQASSLDILLQNSFQRKRLEWNVLEREGVLKRLDEIEASYQRYGHEKSYSQEEQMYFVQNGLHKEEENFKKIEAIAQAFDKKWREKLKKIAITISPTQRRELPTIPPLLTSSNSTTIIETYKIADERFSTKIWRLFFWLTPLYYLDKIKANRIREEEAKNKQEEEKRQSEERIQRRRKEEDNIRTNTVKNLIQKLHKDILIEIPPGTFMMGGLPNDDYGHDEEYPCHKTTLTTDFFMSKYPCTQDLYKAVMGVNPSRCKGAKKPVDNVSWCEAILFCNTLSKLEGLIPCYDFPAPFEKSDDWSKKVKWNQNANGYRLPTEAEWEYCSRGGESHTYSGSNNIDEVAWYIGNSKGTTHPVGQKKTNGFGLYDMSGNVREWVWDSYQREYDSSVIDPVHVNAQSSYRIFRGGSWNRDASSSRNSFRGERFASSGYALGFRFVRTAVNDEKIENLVYNQELLESTINAIKVRVKARTLEDIFDIHTACFEEIASHIMRVDFTKDGLKKIKSTLESLPQTANFSQDKELCQKHIQYLIHNPKEQTLFIYNYIDWPSTKDFFKKIRAELRSFASYLKSININHENIKESFIDVYPAEGLTELYHRAGIEDKIEELDMFFSFKNNMDYFIEYYFCDHSSSLESAILELETDESFTYSLIFLRALLTQTKELQKTLETYIRVLKKKERYVEGIDAQHNWNLLSEAEFLREKLLFYAKICSQFSSQKQSIFEDVLEEFGSTAFQDHDILPLLEWADSSENKIQYIHRTLNASQVYLANLEKWDNISIDENVDMYRNVEEKTLNDCSRTERVQMKAKYFFDDYRELIRKEPFGDITSFLERLGDFTY